MNADELKSNTKRVSFGKSSGKLFKILFISLVALCGCTPTDIARKSKSIGTATMMSDGTIRLQLRAEDEKTGMIGDALFEYGPNHPEYPEIKKHLGDIHPGESKTVSPWKN